jgi:DNA topoisomerase-1
MTKLVIVESPGKINKIKSYLGPGYIVMASVGHIRDLSKNSISVDPNNNFKPTYEITHDKKKVVNNLKNAAKNATEIIIASDGDREGEAIGYHLVEVLNAQEYKRIIFNEITKSAISKALNNPRQLDMNMFYSQQTRRILDRIVGYKLSPILKSINGLQSNSLGAGRVQSVVTRIIVEKEREIENYIKSKNNSIYNVTGDFTINKSKFKGTYIHKQLINDQFKLLNTATNKLYDFNTYKFDKTHIDSFDHIKIIIYQIKNDQNFFIKSISNNDRLRHPQQPFITSTLQQEASYKLKFQLKKTMGLAQKLYEKGLITYMRTDSPALSNEALNYIKKQILEDLGEDYYQFRQFKAKGSAQEAHEAIRPTHFNVFELSEYDLNKTDEEKLYQLIWNRTIASQMKPAKFHDQHIILSNKNKIEFEGTNSIMVFDGYLKIYMEENEESKHIKLNDHNLKNNNIQWTKIHFKETYGSTPNRYNEPSLVKKLESLGIGRPSTYASIISKIQEHKYIRIGNIEGIEKKVKSYILNSGSNKLEKKISIQKIGNDTLKLLPTSDGYLVTDYLVNNFPQIMDYKFTAKMEQLLDEIAEGNKIWYNVLREFYDILQEQFTKLNLNIETNIIKEKKENIIIGKHPKYGNIYYLETRYGPAFKINLKNKDIFVGAGKIKLTDENILSNVIKLIEYKINNKK